VKAKVISLVGRGVADPSDILPRLEGVAAIFEAIESAELLAALPDCEVAQAQHRTAVSLLALAQRELLSICRDLKP
jgi:hypothetical protein